MKLIVFAVGLLALSVNGKMWPYSITLIPNSDYNWDRFYANIVVKLNFGKTSEFVRTTQSIPLSPPNPWSFGAGPSRKLESVKNITFMYTSVRSTEDKFAMKELQLGQHIRYRDVYYRTFDLQAPEWLEQNTNYVAIPRN